MRVLIVDDYQLIREGIKILEGTSDLSHIGEAENSQQLTELLKQGDWDLVILDINVPGINGLGFLKQLREEYPKLPLLVLKYVP